MTKRLNKYLRGNAKIKSELKRALSTIAVLERQLSELKEVDHYIGDSERKLMSENEELQHEKLQVQEQLQAANKLLDNL